MTPTLLTQATHLLTQSERPLFIAHPRPDGDTVGSALALRLALAVLGKASTLTCIHPLPASLAWLPGADVFVQDVAEDAPVDLVIAVDLSDLSRAGGVYKDAWRGHKPLLVIDHHETNNAFGNVNLVDSEAVATAVPMLALIRALGTPVTGDMATCLLSGILTDTRGLRTDNTTAETLALVAELVAAGGDYAAVVQKTLDAVPYQQMRGWGVALHNLQLEDDLAWTAFPLREKEQLGIADHDDLDLGNLLSRVAEANVIASFLEMRDGTVKISFRCRPGYNVATLAKALGGGGHRQAAGCSTPGPLDAAVARVLPLARDLLRAQSAPV